MELTKDQLAILLGLPLPNKGIKEVPKTPLSIRFVSKPNFANWQSVLRTRSAYRR